MVNELLVFLFDLAKNIIWYPLKLTEWRLTAPHSPTHHFTEGKSFLGYLSPSTLEHYLKKGSHQPSNALRNENHV
jgi:hypothetical protein